MSHQSKKWLARQRRDLYVQRAQAEGFRSRAAYKLAEMAERYDLVQPGLAVVDLGAAPGSWSQWLATALGASGQIVAVDRLEIKPIDGVSFIQADITKLEIADQILLALNSRHKGEKQKGEQRKADLVLSDLAPSATGHRATDQRQSEQLALAALQLAQRLLVPGGDFISKTRHGGTDQLILILRQHFASVRFAKPKASRSDSAEIYLIAQTYNKR